MTQTGPLNVETVATLAVPAAIDILLVDDRPKNLLSLEAVLASPEYRLIKAESGDEALRYLLDHSPALILMDVQMPELDGFETAAIIKKSVRTREIPIIFLTAITADEHQAHKGYDYGAVDYINKPFDAHILRSKVAVFAELARKTRQLVEAEKLIHAGERRERERRIAQLELSGLRREQADQRKYLDLVEGIENGVVWSADPESLEIHFVSPSAQTVLGFSPPQWRRSGFLLEHVHPDDRSRVKEAVAQLLRDPENRLRGPKSISFEHRFRVADDRELWLHTGLRLARRAEDGRHELRGLSVNVTRIKDAETRLRRNMDRSDFLAQAGLLLSESLDFEGTLSRLAELVVPRLADWFAVFVRDKSGRPKQLAVSHADPAQSERARLLGERYLARDGFERGVANVMRTGRPELYSQVDPELLAASARDEEHRRYLEGCALRSVMILPLSARGQTLGALLFCTVQPESLPAGAERPHRSFELEDLAFAEEIARRAASAIDHANLYQQAQAAIRARDEFLSIASHELNTPLTPLKLQIQTLLRSLSAGKLAEMKPERVTKMLETSDRQITRLSRLIEDLLDISRINIGQLGLQPERFDAGELVRDVVERFHGQQTGPKCEVTLHAPAGGVGVRWDRFRIEQVVINLLTNAIKYGQGRPVVIQMIVEGERARLSFRDHGIGIAEQDQARIFERFERAVSPTHIGGLGLGLYIVKQIVVAHGGRVQVESRLGEGSTFIVELPLEARMETPAGAPTSDE